MRCCETVRHTVDSALRQQQFLSLCGLVFSIFIFPFPSSGTRVVFNILLRFERFTKITSEKRFPAPLHSSTALCLFWKYELFTLEPGIRETEPSTSHNRSQPLFLLSVSHTAIHDFKGSLSLTHVLNISV